MFPDPVPGIITLYEDAANIVGKRRKRAVANQLSTVGPLGGPLPSGCSYGKLCKFWSVNRGYFWPAVCPGLSNLNPFDFPDRSDLKLINLGILHLYLTTLKVLKVYKGRESLFMLGS